MLTRDDQTVEDCLDVVEIAHEAGVQHVGFKDVGVERSMLAALNELIKRSNAVSYMEIVSTTSEAMIESARFAAGIGVDQLLGGQAVEDVLDVLDGTGIGYYPFPGRPRNHPTRLGGTPDDIASDCSRYEALGCLGVDLLAYRAVEAEPLALVHAARRALTGTLVVAGSIESRVQVLELANADVDAITIGTAALNGSFSPRKGSLRSQLRDILDACASLPATTVQ